MKYPLKLLQENISGIWVNERYDLILGMQPYSIFTFADDTGKGIDGKYSVVQPSEDSFPILRLVDSEGISHDFVINELFVFDTLIISREGEIIHLKNVLPDDYESGNYNR